jgi:hypothetical protein
MLDPVELKCPQVVRIPKLRTQLLEDRPIPLLTVMTHLVVKVAHQIGNHPVIVEEGVVHVHEENHLVLVHFEPPP